jgi:hypothetical protein
MRGDSEKLVQPSWMTSSRACVFRRPLAINTEPSGFRSINYRDCLSISAGGSEGDPLEIGDKISCYALDDEIRVLSNNERGRQMRRPWVGC